MFFGSRPSTSPRAVIAATVAATFEGSHCRSGAASSTSATAVVAAVPSDTGGLRRCSNSTPRGGPSTPVRGGDTVASAAVRGSSSRSRSNTQASRTGVAKRGNSITVRPGRHSGRGVTSERSCSAGSRRRRRSDSTPPSPPLPVACSEGGELQGDSSSSSAKCRAASSEQQTRDQILFRKSLQNGAESCVRVAVRFRPLKLEEGSEGPAFRVRPDGRIVESSDLAYSFELDRAFASEVSQAQMYHEVGFPVVADVLSGYNGTVLAYGQTGSGKTHCMFGPTLELPAQHGLIPRAARQIFDTIRCGADDVQYVLRCSLLEVYCEQLRDLLDPSNGDLRIQETPQRGVLVEGLTQECVEREEDVLDILQTGEQMRVVACTKLNHYSSRSHVLFFLSCVQRLPDGSEKVGKLSLADLAGSERVGNSGALSVGGARLQEATKINCSLSALGHVIQALVEKQGHVPYRNSQLTRVLQETLGGNCKTALIVTCSAASSNYGETLSSLRFATRARLVRNRVKVNLIRSSEQLTDLVAQLQRELASARREAKRLGLESDSLATSPPWNALPVSPHDDGTDVGGSSCDESANDAHDIEPSPAAAKPKRKSTSLENSEAMKQCLADALAETHALAETLEIQDEQMKAASKAAAPQEIAEACDFLNRRGRVKSLAWRTAVMKLKEREASAEVVEAEERIARLEDDLANSYERRRSQRFLARRQQTQSGAGSNALAGDSSIPAIEALGESTMSFSMDRSTCHTSLRTRKTFISSAGHRASKVVRPISRRSIERRSVGGTSSASSHSATPRVDSPRGKACELDDGSLSPAPERFPALGSADAATVEMSHMDVDASALGSMKLPSTSTFLPHGTEHSHIRRMSDGSSKMPATRGASRESGRGQTEAWSDMVDEDDMMPSAAVGKPKGTASSSHLSAEEQLRREIAQLRLKQEQARNGFEEMRGRSDENFRRDHATWKSHLSDLEATWKSSRGAIPRLMLELEQVDVALEEAEATEDALELELIRLGRACAYQVQRLNLRRGLAERMSPQNGTAGDFESAYLRASSTLQHLSRNLKTANGAELPGQRTPGSSCASALGSASSEKMMSKECGPVPRSTSFEGKFWQHTPVRRHSSGKEGVAAANVINATALRSFSADAGAARVAMAPAMFVRHATSFPIAATGGGA